MKLTKYILHVLSIFLVNNYAHCTVESLQYTKKYPLNPLLNEQKMDDNIGIGLDYNEIQNQYKYVVNADLKLNLKNNHNFDYSLSEFYGTKNTGETTSWSVGRKIIDWNPNEKYWMLGFLNATQSFELLSTKQEGLTGILYEKKTTNYDLDVFISYLFIPQINPSVEIKNGEIIPSSSWMRTPPKYTEINGTTFSLFYDIKKINYQKILLNKSFGANYRYKWNKGHLAVFAIYKPENKLRVNGETNGDSVIIDPIFVHADPTVNHHAYAGTNILQHAGDFTLIAGLSYVDPNAHIGEDIPLFKIQNSRKTFYTKYFKIAPSYVVESYSHLSAEYHKENFKMTTNYIQLLSKNQKKADDFYSEAGKWKRAVGLNFNYKIFDELNFNLDLKYDTSLKDTIIQFESKYTYDKKYFLALGFQILDAPSDTSYWVNYRANDLAYSTFGFTF